MLIHLTHLPVENDAPDEPEDQFVIAINDVRRSDIHQFNLGEGCASGWNKSRLSNSLKLNALF